MSNIISFLNDIQQNQWKMQASLNRLEARVDHMEKHIQCEFNPAMPPSMSAQDPTSVASSDSWFRYDVVEFRHKFTFLLHSILC